MSKLLESSREWLPALAEVRRALQAERASVTTALPKLKKAIDGKYGYDPEPKDVGTKADRPKASGGDSTAAGVKPKSVDNDGTKAGVKPKDVEPKKDEPKKAPAKQSRSRKGSSKSKPDTSCPGGQKPRMVFGKWRCVGGGGDKPKLKKKTAKKKATPKKQPGFLARAVKQIRKVLNMSMESVGGINVMGFTRDPWATLLQSHLAFDVRMNRDNGYVPSAAVLAQRELHRQAEAVGRLGPTVRGDYWQEWSGSFTLQVGFKDNRDKAALATAVESLRKQLEAHGYKLKSLGGVNKVPLNREQAEQIQSRHTDWLAAMKRAGASVPG